MKKNIIKVFTAILLPFVSVLSLWAVTIPEVGYGSDFSYFGTGSDDNAIEIYSGTLRSTRATSVSDCIAENYGSVDDQVQLFITKHPEPSESDISDFNTKLMFGCAATCCDGVRCTECSDFATGVSTAISKYLNPPVPVSTDIAFMALMLAAYLGFAAYRKKHFLAKA